MKDYTHELSVRLAEHCTRGGEYTGEQRLLVTYGMEIILNNILKYVLMFLLALLLGRGMEALVMLVIFAVLRCLLGGVHCKTDTGCFLAMTVWMLLSLACAEFFSLAFGMKWPALVCIPVFSELVTVFAERREKHERNEKTDC